MDLYAGNTYWDKTLTSQFNFEKLSHNINSDILIIGAGISGALCAYILSSNGLKVTVIDKDKIGHGSTAANTGLLQYSSDKRISKLIKEKGLEDGVLFYKMCLEAMDKLTTIIDKLESETDYRLRDSINYASEKKDRKLLFKDYEYLSKFDFPVEFLENDELKEKYNINKTAALKTWHDAEVNPFKLVQALTKKNIVQGVKYYEHTEIDLDRIMDKQVHTKEGHKINYKSIILSTGYTKIYPVIEDKCITYRTYAFCSFPMNEHLWKDNAMIWETNIPYLYFRSTPDNRIIAGGLDEEINEIVYDEKKIMKKAEKIARKIENIFPHLHIDIQYAWNALFYGSKDGMPFIGRDPINPNLYYLLGYEGNGTCYSVAGSLILNDIIKGKKNIYENLVKVNRT